MENVPFRVDTVVGDIISKFEKRAQDGHIKYGTTMDRTDLSVLEWINHAQEELMDGIIYLQKLKKLYESAPVNTTVTAEGANP